MGLLSKLRGISDPVDGEFRVVACSSNSGGAVFENCSMDGVIIAAGIDPVSVHHTFLLTPTAKWPYPGVVLPVTLDREHPDRFTINWDSVPSSRDVARMMAEQQAQQLRQTSSATGAESGANRSSDGAPHGIQVAGAPGRPVPGAAGGGLTPEESAAANAGQGAAIGLAPTTANVLAAHEVPIPAGVIGAAPGGVWDLTLDVAASPGYTTVLRVNFSSPARRQQIAVVGKTLPVLADSARHDRITIETSKLPSH